MHFPIALLVIAVFFDGISLFLRERTNVRSAAVALFLLGAVAAVAAVVTGRAAADGILLPSAAQPTLTDHENWAALTAWFYGVYALIRLVLLWFDRKDRPLAKGWSYVLVFLIGAGGLSLLVQTGDRGARLVFQYGVGVQAIPQDNLDQHDHDADHDEDIESDHVMDEPMIMRPTLAENGSWNWTPGQGARQVLDEAFQFLEGGLDDLSITEEDSLISLNLQGGPVLFVTGDAMESIQADIVLNVEQFAGAVRLVHHVRDSLNYDFLALEDGMIRQGRVDDGGIDIFDEETLPLSGWLTMRSVSDGRHFRGYLGAEMRVHGHNSPPEAGPVGLRLEGAGIILLRSIGVQVLR